MSQQTYFADNVETLADRVLRLQPRKILVVTGFSSYTQSGAKSLIDSLFGQCNLVFFNNFSPNPKAEELTDALALHRNTDIDLIVAIGGGSVIDMGKLIRYYINRDVDVVKSIQLNDAFPTQDVPLVTIPTTAGSGSEATHFAVVYIDGRKYSVSQKAILPNYVLLYPSLTYNAPPYLTACSGADALCQAIESYWSVQSTETSRSYAKDAILSLFEYLPQAVKNDINARNKVMFAANLAGRAINISFTTAAHAYSYGLTSYLDIPHGHAVSLTLPYFFHLNMMVSSENCNDPRGVSFVKEKMSELSVLIGCTSKDAMVKLTAFFQQLFGKENDEVKRKISDSLRDKFTSSVNLQRLQNNPVKITREDLDNIKF